MFLVKLPKITLQNQSTTQHMLGRVAYHWTGIHQRGRINVTKCQMNTGRRENKKKKKGIYWQVKPNADKTVLPSAERIVSQHTRVNKKFWRNGTKKLFSLTRLNGGQASNAPRHIFVCLKIAHQPLKILPFLGLYQPKNIFDSVFLKITALQRRRYCKGRTTVSTWATTKFTMVFTLWRAYFTCATVYIRHIYSLILIVFLINPLNKHLIVTPSLLWWMCTLYCVSACIRDEREQACGCTAVAMT